MGLQVEGRTSVARAEHPSPKERPIIFSGPMVQAILAGQKTQTRRLVKLPPWAWLLGADLDRAFPDKAWTVTPCLQVPCSNGTTQRLRNPWGFPNATWGERGEVVPVPTRLWVRETWGDADCFYQGHGNDNPGVVAYRADRSAIQFKALTPRPVPAYDRSTWNWGSIKWRPSIHMPRWASRLTLAVTDVRAQRLQEISEEDARAEGVLEAYERRLYPSRLAARVTSFRRGFEKAWDQLNGKRAPWSTNPWVWAVSFRRLR